MKYYQQSLEKLAETMTSEEKEKIKRESKIFILRHNYFCRVSFSLKKRTTMDFGLSLLRKRSNSIRNDKLVRFFKYCTNR